MSPVFRIMGRPFLVIAATASFVLVACGQEPADTAQPPAGNGTEVTGGVPGDMAQLPTPTPTMVMPVDTTDRINDGYPDFTPTPLPPEVERTEKGARNVLLSWARAVEAREFDQAWELMSQGDHAKWSKAEWTRMFIDLAAISMAVPEGRMDGAAGTTYYTSDATITAKEKDGRPVRYTGEVTLTRVNDVPGATPEQLHWKIQSVTLDWDH